MPQTDTPTPTSRTGRARRTAAVLGAALGVAGALLAATPVTANAADPLPSEEDLLSHCNTADYCKYTAKALDSAIGPKHQVGNKVINCAGTVHRTWSWSETTSQTTNASISSTLASALWEPVSLAATASFGKSFEKSHTHTVTVDRTMEPFTMAYITRGTGYNIIYGDWELHFPNRFHGHYVWYDNGYQVKVENPDGGWEAYNYRPLSDAEVKQYCGNATPNGRGRTTLTQYLKGGSELNQRGGWVGGSRRGIAFGDSSS
ncbi:hypothetical protein ABZX85_46900 [Streptomyces sp. NPDC004539]|uniref:hypothetical protein n=1 Tax=Streptomyces sp. NPDC004539 TaxID=3154280 RepID=UPI0033A01170